MLGNQKLLVDQMSETTKKIVIYGLSPDTGGTEKFIYRLLDYLDRRIIIYVIFYGGRHPSRTSCPIEVKHKIEQRGGEIYNVYSKNDTLSYRKLWRAFSAARKQTDTVAFEINSIYNIVPYLYARLLRFKIIIAHAHNTENTSRASVLQILHRINRVFVR